MNLSYWEYKSWLSNIEFAIIGSGIVGLITALFLKERFPKAKIIILEKGILPQGASTKNAGFACFGSISEIISDLKNHSEEEVFELVKRRFDGIQLLEELVGDKNLDLHILGGHEVFLDTQNDLFEICSNRMQEINQLLKPIFGDEPFKRNANSFGFRKVNSEYISHKFEGQLDTGKMVHTLMKKAHEKGILILNAVTVETFSEFDNGVEVKTDKFEFITGKLFVATNGFASLLLDEEIRPARAQVLITKPIDNLKIEGTFQIDEGYYYFRNVDRRVLFGGGRKLDFDTEETLEFGQTSLIQNELERLLQEVILPDTPYEIEHRWSGIMGIGSQKKPIVKQISNNVFCGVRLGGMGVAIGSLVGKELAKML